MDIGNSVGLIKGFKVSTYGEKFWVAFLATAESVCSKRCSGGLFAALPQVLSY